MQLIWFGWMLWCGVFTAPGATLYVHPFYVSVTDIVYNQKEKELELSCRIFADDLEKAINQQSGSHTDILKPANPGQTEAGIRKYVTEHLSVALNQKKQQLSWVGYQLEEGAVWVYLEIKNVPVFRYIEVRNPMLFEQHPEQINIVHVTVKGRRQSKELRNPESLIQFEF